MPRFASREEYLAWKASQQEGAVASPPAAAPPAVPAIPSVPARRAIPAVAAAPAARSVPAVSVPDAPADPAAKPKQGLKETFSGLPGWSWIFIVACLAIPVASLGGALPGAVGFGSAAGCASLAKKPGWETTARVMVCAAVTGGAWLLFLVFAAAFASIGK